MEKEQLVLEATGIYKSFGGNHVLRGIDYRLKKGEVHALLGINGAGKSTFIKIISGALTQDKGIISIDGQVIEGLTPKKAQEMGTSTIYQETSLYPKLSILENLFVGKRITKRSHFLDWKEMEKKAGLTFEKLGVEADLYKKVEDVGKAMAQLVEIAKSLIANCKILIMDEPTASLSHSETEKLFDVIRKLKNEGTSIIYISHRMEEIFEITDTVTVLRDGEIIATKPTSEVTADWVAKSMLGKVQNQMCGRCYCKTGEKLLEVNNLCSGGLYDNICFDIKRGEVVALAGLVGSGRTEIARSIFGIDGYDRGEIKFRGQKVKNKTWEVIKDGIAMVPEDRGKQGLVLNMTAHENMVLTALKSFSKKGIRNMKTETSAVSKMSKDLLLNPNITTLTASSYSGGNQQKIVLGKWLTIEPDLLILDEPTSGVDVGAKAEIYKLIDRLAEAGKGILFISSDLNEVELIADRILVIRQGKIVGELPKGADTETILTYAISGKGE